MHPRIERLQQQVASLPVSAEYRHALYMSIERYADQIIERQIPNDGWDDLEALQQVTLGDMMEQQLQQCVPLALNGR